MDIRRKRPGLPICVIAALTIAVSASGIASGADQDKSPIPAAMRTWSYSLALQAATWGAPAVIMYSLRFNDCLGPHPLARPNHIWRMADISTPELSRKAGYVSPNVNTIYGFGFLDLRHEPIILEVPDSHGLYYVVEIVDMWTNAFAYAGGKSTGYSGGKFALVGPGWRGELPAGVRRIDCPTPWVLIQPRVHIYVDGKIDLRRAETVLNAIRPVPLGEYLGKPASVPSAYHYAAPIFADPGLPVSAMDFRDPMQFWEILGAAIYENPPPHDQLTALLPMFKPLGLEIGKPWDPSKLPPAVLAAMAEASGNIGKILAHIPVGSVVGDAMLPPPNTGAFGTDYLTRAVIARVGLTANIPYEAVYWVYYRDKTGRSLTGDHKYIMIFKEPIPVYKPGFWSLTLYDANNNYTIPNPLNRYMVGSDTPTLKRNPDGSFTIYIQKDSPGPDKESNWLPAPAGEFYLMPRAYAPKPGTIAILNDARTWPVPAVTPAD